MPTVAELRTKPSDTETLAAELVEHLRGMRRRLVEEIRSYPTPITRCDAQFNHLYEQQARLACDLYRMENETPSRALIEQFVASAPYTDDPAERDFRSRIGKEIAALNE
jgi:hypothetical protein